MTAAERAAAGIPAADVVKRMPRTRVLAITFAIAAVGAGLAQLALQVTFRAARHPVSLAQANVEADPAVVRGWYAQLSEQGTYLQFIRAELVDLLWPVMLAIAIVSLYRLVGGLLRDVDPPIAAWLYRWAPVWAVGPAFDLVENAFSLAMLTDPDGFPEWWAIAHVVASWLKLLGSVAAAVVGPTLTVIALARARRGQRASDARPAVPPW